MGQSRGLEGFRQVTAKVKALSQGQLLGNRLETRDMKDFMHSCQLARDGHGIWTEISLCFRPLGLGSPLSLQRHFAKNIIPCGEEDIGPRELSGR